MELDKNIFNFFALANEVSNEAWDVEDNSQKLQFEGYRAAVINKKEKQSG